MTDNERRILIKEFLKQYTKELSDDLIRKIRVSHQVKGIREGLPRDGWILVDYGNVIVHLFSPDQRDYYALEDLWEGGKALVHIQ